MYTQRNNILHAARSLEIVLLRRMTLYYDDRWRCTMIRYNHLVHHIYDNNKDRHYISEEHTILDGFCYFIFIFFLVRCFNIRNVLRRVERVAGARFGARHVEPHCSPSITRAR